jgi:hypothetical protein
VAEAGGKTKEKGREAAGSGEMAFIYADTCSDATARCAAAKLLPFAAPLLGAGDEASEDDEASMQSLTQ